MAYTNEQDFNAFVAQQMVPRKQDPNPTAFVSVSAAMEEARSLAFRVSELVDRLCGIQPEAVSGGAGSVPGSLLGTIRADAEQTTEAIRRASAQLNRLDRELP